MGTVLQLRQTARCPQRANPLRGAQRQATVTPKVSHGSVEVTDWVLLILGGIAFVLEENEYPLAPMILALILGPLIEENFMKSTIKADGQLIEFFMRPIAGTLGGLTLLVWAVMIGLALRRRYARPAPAN